MSGFAANGKGSDEVFGTTGRANSGTTFGPRGRINFIQGANVSIAVSEDGPTEELRVTISAAGGGNLSTYETGQAYTASIAPSGNTSVSTSWPGTFSPHGLILVAASPSAADDFFSIGFCRGDFGGIQAQSSITTLNANATVNVSTGMANVAGETLGMQTPTANNWNVFRNGLAGPAWSAATMTLGRATI